MVKRSGDIPPSNLGSDSTMIFRKIRSEGLSHNSYFIADSGDAAVIDPRRDCQVYLDLASSSGSRITHIFETHRNEDYVSGALELSGRTGAAVYHGAALDFSFGRPVLEADRFRIGRLELAVLETPGHTRESISLVMCDLSVSRDPLVIFTGDALFAGDVGRTDLLGPEKAEWAAGTLYDALHGKVLPLGDGVIVCPAHGAGSVCGGEIADLELSTIGFERAHNPCFQLDRESFIAMKNSEHQYRPPTSRRWRGSTGPGRRSSPTFPAPFRWTPRDSRRKGGPAPRSWIRGPRKHSEGDTSRGASRFGVMEFHLSQDGSSRMTIRS